MVRPIVARNDARENKRHLCLILQQQLSGQWTAIRCLPLCGLHKQECRTNAQMIEILFSSWIKGKHRAIPYDHRFVELTAGLSRRRPSEIFLEEMRECPS